MVRCDDDTLAECMEVPPTGQMGLLGESSRSRPFGVTIV
jgi:hypothetical protein